MDWLINKIGDFTLWITKGGLRGIGKLGVECTGIFIIVGIIGLYITMSGNRKLGTKITSSDLMIYLLLKVLSNV
ncbi:hypothetical protein FDC27_05030 [Clostridium botulinum]|nr:hypothetical protein [Clostridium botulinum]NFO66340.1 hypothetical protein [Clostridium botulinum]